MLSAGTTGSCTSGTSRVIGGVSALVMIRVADWSSSAGGCACDALAAGCGWVLANGWVAWGGRGGCELARAAGCSGWCSSAIVSAAPDSSASSCASIGVYHAPVCSGVVPGSSSKPGSAVSAEGSTSAGTAFSGVYQDSTGTGRDDPSSTGGSCQPSSGVLLVILWIVFRRYGFFRHTTPLA